jgi:hypothetical protein
LESLIVYVPHLLTLNNNNIITIIVFSFLQRRGKKQKLIPDISQSLKRGNVETIVEKEYKMDSLVDLSLFAYSPTNDHNFTNQDTPAGYTLQQSTTWPPRGRSHSALPQPTMKPLPKVPKRGLCVIMPDSRNKCILKRIKRVRLDAVLGDRHLTATPSAYATAPSAYINPNSNEDLRLPEQNQTLQERRNPSSIPQLTLPNNTSDANQNSNLPMIWLADEQMWLVADPTDPGYGYYATGPEEGDEWLPPYTEQESPASNPSSSDLSPVREQFLSLMAEPPRPPPRINPDEPRLSPLFQEAMQGLGTLDLGGSDYSLSSAGSQEKQEYGRQYIAYRPSHAPQHPSSRWYESGVSTPRSESQALRGKKPANSAVDSWTSKYASEAEIRRQKERMNRRRLQVEREVQQNIDEVHLGANIFGTTQRQRRDSWHSDSGVSAASIPISPENRWGIQRASSARH